MKRTKLLLSRAETTAVFAGVKPIISPAQLADILGLSVKTIYEWIGRGRLDGTFKKRGKHIRFWRDRAIDRFFNGEDWNGE